MGGNSFTLVDPDGTQTVFTPGQSSTEYLASTVSWQSTPDSARLVYEASYKRLKMMIAPAAEDVRCEEVRGPDYALTTPGCRTLTFQYSTGQYPYEDRLTSVTYHNATGSGEQVVAQYAYDENGKLSEAWDPRISPALKERYTYQSSYGSAKLSTLTPPGQETLEFDYYGTSTNPLKSISQPSLLLEGPSEAQTTIAYDVPVRGSGAPYDLSPGAVSQWGQSDYPVSATAIFPPDQIPGDPPSDYSHATVHYMDPDGQVVNTASPAPPGLSGDVISTAENDEHGNVIRSLSAQNRLRALADSDPVTRSRLLDSRSIYSADGTELQEEWGPMHEIKLEGYTRTYEGRMHTTTRYDEGAPAPPSGTPWPHLPTTETTGAWLPGRLRRLRQADDEDRVRLEPAFADGDDHRPRRPQSAHRDRL